ncbi:MAG TPA: fused MFS/spermidine synthase [Candidatus Sulfopaludibacter sp.]|nr:fused MFS/spermidine synthase [Candidatus Sulfopaludibacter sp.]
MSRSSRLLPLLLILFAASGCSALIYEIVWYQMLQLAIGSTAVSLGFLLASFMGGLCIGSIGLPRYLAKRNTETHPLRIYAVLEAGIGVLGILVLFGIPLVDRVYVAGAEHGLPGMLLRGFISAVCLLPPTILMGASLPALVRWVEHTPRGVSWWGLLYAGNTLGAVFGCLLAGFYLLRVHNMATATVAAALLNFAIAAASYVLAGRTPAREEAESPAPAAPALALAGELSANWPVYLTIAISGATALGAEVVWTRLLAMLLGSTVYVFSIILAVFLAGLAIGSGLGSMLLRSMRTAAGPRLALGWSQFLLTLGIAWTAYMIADSLPYWPVNPMLSSSPWYNFQLDMARCLWAILPPTILWGASFPLACASVSSDRDDPSGLVGAVYAANTFGAILGALVVSLSLVPAIGTQNSTRVILLLSAVGALAMLLPQIGRSRSMALTAGVTAAVLVSIQLARGVDPIPGKVIAYGRRIMISSPNSELLYTVEGRNSSVAITRWNDGAIEVDVNGHVEATTEPYDMKLQRMVGHLPAMIHPNPKSVLGIGFGAGVSAGTFTRYPGIEHITVCEIEPVIPPTSTRYFAKQDYDVYHNPRTRIVYDDARHYLMTTTDHYDIIASDPLDVFVKGTAALYTKEYFEAVKRHLNPGGMFTLYVPLYESDTRTVKSELATFFEAFPQGTVWANTVEGRGYDMVFMGQQDALRIDLDEMHQRLARPDFALVAESLREIGVGSPIDLMATYAGRKPDFAQWLADADLNRDGDLRLQYLGGWGINSSMEDVIYREMMRYRRAPTELFTGSPEHLQSLMVALNAP